MTNLFDIIGQVFGFIGDFLMSFVNFFITIGRAMVYLNTVLAFMPIYLKVFISLFISISIVLMILNRG